MAGRYAQSTEVTVERSQLEIELILSRYGADQFMRGWDGEKAVLAFRAHGRQVRFILPLPARDSSEFTTYQRSSRGGRSTHLRTAEQAYKLWEQACRQRWRALALAVKAKLEAVEVGITTFDEEFLAHIVLPNGSQVGEWMLPQIEHAYLGGGMPTPLLEAGRR